MLDKKDVSELIDKFFDSLKDFEIYKLGLKKKYEEAKFDLKLKMFRERRKLIG